MIIIWKWDPPETTKRIKEDKILIPIGECKKNVDIISEIKKFQESYNDPEIIVMVHTDVKDRTSLFDSRKTEFRKEKIKIKPFGQGEGVIYYNDDKKTGFLDGTGFTEDITESNFDEVWQYYWEDKDEKKKLIPMVLPFCLYCENAYKFNSFENNKMKIQVELEKIENENFKDKFEFPENIRKLWGKIEDLLDGYGRLKENEMKKFIGLKEDGSKVPMEETEWLTLLGDLKHWAG